MGPHDVTDPPKTAKVESGAQCIQIFEFGNPGNSGLDIPGLEQVARGVWVFIIYHRS